MRSISTKLILAFLSIGIVSVAVIFLAARWNTRAEFIRFLNDQTQSEILEVLTEYHLENGSWNRVETILIGRQPGMGPGRMHRSPPFVLTDENGVVIASNDKYRRGETLTRAQLSKGSPILVDDKVVGILVPIGYTFVGQPRELEFIDRTNRTLLFGALIGAVIALLLGVFLSQTLTRPIRELTRATHAVSAGDLSQQVPVRSDDELGELAQAFNRMSAQLSRSVNARKQMTADIAHELRTPLSLILGHAEAVHDEVLPPTRENFEIIREEATRLERMVNDLRTLSLADAGELRMQLQTIEPGQLIREVAALYQVQAQKKNITFRLDLRPSLPDVDVDPGRMTQVLTNILENAIRHTPENGQISLRARQVSEAVELSVQDSGPGLKTEDNERIFERFYRTDTARQREDGGSGLGLAIAKSIVQAHGGQIRAESEPGRGLTITISLPRKSSFARLEIS
jgi:signal transduction histidine kinase